MPNWVSTHVLHWIRNPDPGSDFERATKLVRWLPGPALIGLMRQLGYDGLLLERSGIACAHLFFQQRADAWHMFSLWVAAELRGRGLASQLVGNFIEAARAQPTINKIRLGAGGDSAVRAIFDSFAAKKDQLGLLPAERFFMSFTDRSVRASQVEVQA